MQKRIIMGEQNETAVKGINFFFCRKEDVGTEKEQWQPIEVDNVKIRLATDIPELESEKLRGWGYTCSFTASMEPTPALTYLQKNTWKRERGRRYYCEKLLRHTSKKTLRKYCYLLRKYASFIRKENK